MSDAEVSDINFSCPTCGETLEVNRSMMEALIDKGCVICGADVTDQAFSQT